MMNPMLLGLFVLVLHAALGCAENNDTYDENTAEISSAVIDNALDANGIDANGLLINGIDANGLDPQFMSSTLNSALTNPGSSGNAARLLYKYLIGCALNSTQSVTFTWQDSFNIAHTEVYWGSLGLAPTWVNTSLSATARRWVSACIAARANYYSVPVTISLRGQHAAIKHLGFIEQWAYPMEEGAFWGDLFDSTPQLYACYKETNVAHSRSKLRECAAGHVTQSGIVECGSIMITGSCDSICDAIDSNGYYRPRCLDVETGTMTDDLVTVFLPQ
jgi:hypothetical protein